MSKHIVIVVALAVASLGAGPCDQILGTGDPGAGDGGVPEGCEAAGCTDQLTVEIIRADNTEFLPGVYEFTLTDQDGGQAWIECYLGSVEMGMECTLGDLQVVQASLGLGGTGISLEVAAVPLSVNIVVDYGGWTIGERDIVPAYEEYSPNGYQCPPTCQVAEESMAVMPW